MTAVRLPTELVIRYRAVDREEIGAPAHVVDTPAHLDFLTDDVGRNGILIPLDLAFNERFATLDGNHRIAVAARLKLSDVPIALRRVPTDNRPYWAQTMRAEDYEILEAAYQRQDSAV